MLNAATLDLHLSKFSSQVASNMKANLYVDNLVSGCDSEDEVIGYYKQARHIISAARFNLCSWSSNSCRLHSIIVQDKTNAIITVLGLRCDTLKDTLLFTLQNYLHHPQLLPRGRYYVIVHKSMTLLAPVTVKAKILVQTLWKQKGQTTNQELTKEWSNIAEDIKEATTIPYPRPYFVAGIQLFPTTQLHIYPGLILWQRYNFFLQQHNFTVLLMKASELTDYSRPLVI